MEKYLVTIEFRYRDKPKNENDCSYKSKTITIGVYDTFNEACENGNNILEVMESKFKLHVFPSGEKAKKERFSKNGGSFKSKKALITNLAYLQTPFQFFAQIKTLKYTNTNESIDDIVTAIKRYKHSKNLNK